MIYSLLLISGALTLFILRWKSRFERGADSPGRQWVKVGKYSVCSKDPKYLFVKGVLEFLVPFTIAALIYSCLQLWVDASLHSVTASTTIRQLEEKIRAIRLNYVAPIKLSDTKQLILIISVVLIGYFSPRIARLGLLKKYKRATTYITRLYILLTILASFTFFSSQLCESIDASSVRLNQQIDQIEAGYSDYHSALARVAEKTVAREIIDDDENKEFIDELTRVVNEAIRAHSAIRAAKYIVDHYPHIGARDFKLDAESFKDDSGDDGPSDEPDDPGRGPTGPKKPGPDGGDGLGPGGGHNGPSEPKEPKPEGAEDWNLESAQRLSAEIREAEQVLDAGGHTNATEIIEKSVDAVHSDVIKSLLLNLIPDGNLRSFLEVGLDADVLYNFKDRVSDFTLKVFEATARKRRSVRDALTEERQALRAQIRPRIQETRDAVLHKLQAASLRERGKANRAEQIRLATPGEILRKGERQYSEQLALFRKNWKENYDFGEYDTTLASTVLRTSIEKKLALVENPLERVEALNDYSRKISFRVNDTRTLKQKYEFLTNFEAEELKSSSFERNTKAWFKPSGEQAAQSSVRKYCGECGARVPSSSHVGGRCPFCGVLWTAERERRTSASEDAYKGAFSIAP
jgi:hypothetical protein